MTNESAPADEIAQVVDRAAFAFRGYNVTNLGKTPEMLRHPAYGPILERFLDEASQICSAAIKRKVNLAGRVRRRAKTTLRTYAQDLAMIVAVELGQLKLLEEFFGVSTADAQLMFGYSLGEVTAVIAGGVFDMETALKPILVLARDAATLGRDVKMGVLFSRGAELDLDLVEELCLQITNLGRGVIAVSTYLSPNTVLLMGQADALEIFKKQMRGAFPEQVHLRKNPHRWPPLHTPITRQKNIPNRASVMLDTAPGGFTAPVPPILSCVTGETSYNARNSREILSRWVDHPQRLWDVIDKMFAAGVETVIHTGPEPNIIPATLTRLSNNVALQLRGRSFSSISRRAISRIIRRRRWLPRLLRTDAALLRAPSLQQIVLEEWLLRQDVG